MGYDSSWKAVEQFGNSFNDIASGVCSEDFFGGPEAQRRRQVSTNTRRDETRRDETREDERRRDEAGMTKAEKQAGIERAIARQSLASRPSFINRETHIIPAPVTAHEDDRVAVEDIRWETIDETVHAMLESETAVLLPREELTEQNDRAWTPTFGAHSADEAVECFERRVAEVAPRAEMRNMKYISVDDLMARGPSITSSVWFHAEERMHGRRDSWSRRSPRNDTSPNPVLEEQVCQETGEADADDVWEYSTSEDGQRRSAERKVARAGGMRNTQEDKKTRSEERHTIVDGDDAGRCSQSEAIADELGQVGRVVTYAHEARDGSISTSAQRDVDLDHSLWLARAAAARSASQSSSTSAGKAGCLEPLTEWCNFVSRLVDCQKCVACQLHKERAQVTETAAAERQVGIQTTQVVIDETDIQGYRTRMQDSETQTPVKQTLHTKIQDSERQTSDQQIHHSYMEGSETQTPDQRTHHTHVGPDETETPDQRTHHTHVGPDETETPGIETQIIGKQRQLVIDAGVARVDEGSAKRRKRLTEDFCLHATSQAGVDVTEIEVARQHALNEDIDDDDKYYSEAESSDENARLYEDEHIQEAFDNGARNLKEAIRWAHLGGPSDDEDEMNFNETLPEIEEFERMNVDEFGYPETLVCVVPDSGASSEDSQPERVEMVLPLLDLYMTQEAERRKKARKAAKRKERQERKERDRQERDRQASDAKPIRPETKEGGNGADRMSTLQPEETDLSCVSMEAQSGGRESYNFNSTMTERRRMQDQVKMDRSAYAQLQMMETSGNLGAIANAGVSSDGRRNAVAEIKMIKPAHHRATKDEFPSEQPRLERADGKTSHSHDANAQEVGRNAEKQSGSTETNVKSTVRERGVGGCRHEHRIFYR